MARLSGKLKVTVYTDTDASNYPLSKVTDIEDTLADSTINQWEQTFIQVSDGAIDQAISFNGIVPEYLIILSDQQVTIKINGGSSLPVNKLYLEGTSVSTLAISNDSGVTANIRLCVGR